jgi:hypothetical protein
MKRTIIAVSAALALTCLAHTAAAAGLQRVIIVQPTDVAAYLKELDTLRGLFKKAGVTVTLKVWRARFAAAETGTIVVTEEVADLATLAKLDELQKSNPDVVATMARIGKVRKITSDSLYEGL